MIRRSVLLLTLELLVIAPTYADDQSSAGAVNETLQLAETILEHHVLPPTRQEMLASAVRSAYQAAGAPWPLDLSRQMSNAASVDELRRIVVDQLDRLLGQELLHGDQLATSLREGLFAAVPGEARLADAENERVNAQIRSNRYEGTGIALSVNNDVPVMQQVIADGPADTAGALDGDRIEQIDGESTRGMEIQRVIDLLRGPEGTDVTVALRQPDDENARVVTITRGVVPFDTVTGYRLLPGRHDGVAACLQVDRLSASCVHELKQYGQRLVRDGVHGLILDMRNTTPGDVHHAVVLADAFLDGKEIGRVRTHAGDRDYVAEAGELFPGLKLGVLVSRNTRGTAEWLAAALQDAGRAVIFGESTPGEAFASEVIATADDDQVLILSTALLERSLRTTSGESDGFPPSANRHVAGPSTLWGVQPDLPLSSRGQGDIPAAAAPRLLHDRQPPRLDDSPMRDTTEPDRSPSDE